MDQRVTIFGRHFRVVENSHAELVMGRRMMDELGYRSVIIVSSPYHLLRLRLMAWRVFAEGNYELGFESAPDENGKPFGWLRSWEDFSFVLSEYVKIGWFLVYGGFV